MTVIIIALFSARATSCEHSDELQVATQPLQDARRLWLVCELVVEILCSLPRLCCVCVVNKVERNDQKQTSNTQHIATHRIRISACFALGA